MLRGGVSKINDLFDYLQCIAAGLDSQKSKKSNWSEQSKVGKTKISCKEAGSVQYKAHRARATPHAYQLIKVRSWSRVSISYINWQAKIRNKLKNGKK